VVDFISEHLWTLLYIYCRTTAATHVHDRSSRSHAIFTISFTQVLLYLVYYIPEYMLNNFWAL